MKRTAIKPGLYVKLVVLDIAVFFVLFVINIPPQKPTVHNVFLPISESRIQVKKGLPVNLYIKGLNINLPVGFGTYDPSTKDWTIDDTQVYYADTSTLINDHGGVTLVYGHARWPIFGNLAEIKPGMRAIVKTDSGYDFNYSYQSVRMVTPEDTRVLTEGGSPKLVLQTCSGPWDKYRALYYFKLESVSKI
jgi:LPXTG-site transpeptidase (sortase) family protein